MIERKFFWLSLKANLYSFFQDRFFLKLSRLLLGIFLVTFSLNIRTLIYHQNFYLSGNFDPYTSFFFYLTDIVLLITFCCFGIALWRGDTKGELQVGDKIFSRILAIFILLCFLGTFFAQDKILHLWLSFRFLEFFLLYILLAARCLAPKKILLLFLFGMFFQGLLAFFQVIFQSSIGLHFLGEIHANPFTLGIAKIDFLGSKILRAFGTFSHANVLGGAMFISLLFSFLYRKKHKYFFVLVTFYFVILVFSFSKSAFLALFITFLLYIFIVKFKNRKYFILLTVTVFLLLTIGAVLKVNVIQQAIFVNNSSVSERLLYLDISKEMFLSEPFGVGLGGFTLNMQNFSDQKISPWIFQPVHNIFLLSFNELGFVAGLLFALLFGYLFYCLVVIIKKTDQHEYKIQAVIYLSLLVGIITIGFFDHYFFTLYQGQVMLFLSFGLLSRFLKDMKNKFS